MIGQVLFRPLEVNLAAVGVAVGSRPIAGELAGFQLVEAVALDRLPGMGEEVAQLGIVEQPPIRMHVELAIEEGQNIPDPLLDAGLTHAQGVMRLRQAPVVEMPDHAACGVKALAHGFCHVLPGLRS